MGSIHHLIKFIPKLAELTEPLRPLLKKTGNKNNRLNWNETHSKTFTNIKQKIKQIIENKLFDTTKEARIKCDASNKGQGANIEQKHSNVWHTIAFARRFLNNHESRYSTNELELLLHGQEYLSRNPPQPLPPPPSTDDTQFIINTINNFK